VCRHDPEARAHAACPSPDGLAAATLFLRASTDVMLLNSGCGEPLAIAGAWQFYDGPTFHAMLHAARRGAARLRLLRGDALLAGLLAALGPLASGSDDAARLGETCAEAARLWAEAGATLG